MRAQDIMTKDVVTVGPEATVAEIAGVLVNRRVSCVPVVTAEGDVVGIVTASDLIHRRETGTERRRKWWLDMFVDPDTRAREFVKQHGLRARDVMSPVVISVKETAELADVADVLDAHRIRRVPVVRDGKLAGLVSRSDLVRALAAAPAAAASARTDNGALQKAIFQAIRAQPWLNALYVSFTVENGVVDLRGFVDSEAQQKALRILIEEVPGVRRVEDHVSLRTWQTAA